MLADLDAQFTDYVRQWAGSIVPALSLDGRVVLSLTDDRNDHFRLLERTQHRLSGGRLLLPSLVVYRGLVQPNPRLHYSRSPIHEVELASTRKTDPTDPDYGHVQYVTVRMVQVDYRLVYYTQQFSDLTQFQEAWILRCGREFSVFDYTVSGLAEPLRASVVYQTPESVRVGIDELHESGTIYEQSFPLSMDTSIVSAAIDSWIITDPQLTTDMMQ